MGRVLASLHERHGTRLRVGVGVERIEGDTSVQAVRLADGTTIDADLVVVGIGVVPNTEWLADSGLEIGDGIECDDKLCVGVDGIYAAGDVARWHNRTFGRRMRLEHWTIAAEQGGVAGRNAIDPANATSFDAVPYFWSDWYGKRIQFVGIAAEADEVATVLGDLDGDTFLTLYRRGDQLIGALGLEQRSQIMKYRAMLAAGTSWEAALAFARERAAKLAAKTPQQ
jgi:NADPH-dependent 2,4-dienoyl-CoA reductase/sulfur reductase-like enzyme